MCAGTVAERLHGRLFRNLQLLEVQLDELRTILRKKGQEVWIWIACDAQTKVVAAVQVGPRTQALDYVLLITSDGLDLYFYALSDCV